MEGIYRTALGRLPSASEMAACQEFIAAAAAKEQIQDLLWAIAMLPEFQLIH